VLLIPVAKMPPVLLIQRQFRGCVIDTSGNFATGILDNGGAPWFANISVNFWNIRNGFKWDTLVLGANWFLKKAEAKSLVTLSL
jgi:hypothetical protein